MHAPHPLFEGLAEAELAAVTARCRSATVPAGAEVLTEGVPSSALVLVESGTLAVTVRGLEVADRPGGTWLGEFGWLVGGRATATVIARTPAQLALLDDAALDALASSHPRAAARILERVAEQVALRLRTANLRAEEPAPAALEALWGRVSQGFSRALGAMPSRSRKAPSVAELMALTGWDRGLIAGLQPLVREQRFADGDVLVREGAPTGPADSVWLFAEGFAQLVRRGESLRMQGRGEWSGLVAWAAGGERSATVRAAGALRAFGIPFAAIDALADTRQELHVAVVRRLAAQLATDAALENARLAPDLRLPQPARADDRVLTSYGGWQSSRAERRVVHSVEQIREVLLHGDERVVTLRGSGLSFDEQALGDGVVLELRGFDEIRFDPAAGQLPVGAGARWGDVVAALDGTGYLPPIPFWSFAYDVYVREDRPYVDDLAGFTFFQDGNVKTREGAARLGLPFRLIQQTFVVPEDRPLLLERFVAESEARLAAAGFHTALVDSLYLPRDEPFALSSTREGGGFVVTLTYEGPLDFPRLTGELTRLSADLAMEGGRVHLVKNVFAAAEQMERAYAPGLAAWRRAKDRWDPEDRFGSAFLARIFPRHAGRRSSRERS